MESNEGEIKHGVRISGCGLLILLGWLQCCENTHVQNVFLCPLRFYLEMFQAIEMNSNIRQR